MKKTFLFISTIIILFASSCGGDDNNNSEPKIPDELHKVKYEVSIKDDKYKMRITYVEYDTKEVKTVEIDNSIKWSLEMEKVKDISFVYVSCLATPKTDSDEEINVTVSVYIDGKLTDTKTEKNFAAIGEVAGT